MYVGYVDRMLLTCVRTPHQSCTHARTCYAYPCAPHPDTDERMHVSQHTYARAVKNGIRHGACVAAGQTTLACEFDRQTCHGINESWNL